MLRKLSCCFIPIIIVVLIAFVGALALGYFGIIPSLSKVMGTDKPRDLGIKYTETDLKSAQYKIGATYSLLSKTDDPLKSLVFEGEKELKTTFTQEEITANINSFDWQYMPAKDIQIKISDKDTYEATGTLLTDRILPMAQAIGYSSSQIQEAQKYLKIRKDVPFYIKANGKIENGNITLAIEKLELGRLPIPTGIRNEISKYAVEIIQACINAAPGRAFKSVKTDGNGKVSVDGIVPVIQKWSR